MPSLWWLAYVNRAVPMLPETEAAVLTEPCNLADKSCDLADIACPSPTCPGRTTNTPGRFSTINIGPCVRPICSASSRARVSATPPAGYGTTILMVTADCGHAQWSADATTLTATAMMQASFLIAPSTR